MTDNSSFTWPQLTRSLLAREPLSHDAARWSMNEIMSGKAEPVALAGFLTALEAKGVEGAELTAIADAMTDHAVSVDVTDHAVDIVGTGGDLAHTVNISTMASIVIASTGRTVIKHGNRATSSKSGSADVLDALGIRLATPPSAVGELLDTVGIAFLFAQEYHPSMKHVVPTRKGLGIPTVFNLLGPLTNPARPRASVVGVANLAMAPVVADVFARRGTSALVFRGEDGLDEITIQDATRLWEVSDGSVREHVLHPTEDFGLPLGAPGSLRGGDASYNADIARRIFAGEKATELSPIRNAVALNAAAGILAYDAIGAAEPGADFKAAFAKALDEAVRTLESGASADLVARWSELAEHHAAQH